MKRKIALVLTVVMLFAAMIPLQVFAEADKDFENALKVAKSIITIPEEYTEFNYDVSSYNEKRIWNFNWQSKNGSEGSIHVGVDEKGNILNYYNYKPYDYTSPKKLPKYSKQQAETIARDFIKKINPDLLSGIKYLENNNTSIHEYEYNFEYVRTVNGIPFYSNRINVSVNRQTGEVRNYNYNWNNDLTFPSAEGAISVEKAEQAYKEKLGLELQYLYTYDNDKIKIFPAYVPKYKYNSYIDALTGEKVDLNSIYYGYDIAFSSSAEKSQYAMADMVNGTNVVLSEEELKAVEAVSKLITKEEAEKIARNIKTLELTDAFKINYSGMSSSWPEKNEFIWRMEFRNGEDKDSRYVSVSINAATGEVKDFNTYYNHKDGETAKYDEKAAKAAAEALLKELQPVKFNETYYDENSNYNPIPYSSTLPTYYNFAYARKVNGIPFPGNALRVGYDAVTGKITSYNSQWFNSTFPSVEKAMSLDSAYEKLFDEIGLELQYVTEPKSKEQEKVIYNPGMQELNVKLVYGLKAGKPAMLDAFTGDVINYNGDIFKENKVAEYSDIAGHFAESQIKVLAEFGISLEGKEFNPNLAITQKDFLILLSKTLNNYYEPYPVIKGEDQTDSLYALLIRSGIVKEDEKAPESAVTKEDAVKFILRAMKVDKVADIKGIFICDFKDADEISPEMIGYVTIAKGMGIINGFDGYFKPKAELSRAEAVVVIYNYLQK